MSTKIHWTQLPMVNSCGEPCAPECCIDALREFRATNAMNGFFLAADDGEYDDQSGPDNTDVDWTGFDEAAETEER